MTTAPGLRHLGRNGERQQEPKDKSRLELFVDQEVSSCEDARCGSKPGWFSGGRREKSPNRRDESAKTRLKKLGKIRLRDKQKKAHEDSNIERAGLTGPDPIPKGGEERGQTD